MATTEELNRAAGEWQRTAQEVIDVARRAAPVRMSILDAGLFPDGLDPEAAVAAFLAASDGVLAELPNFSEQESTFPANESVEDLSPDRFIVEQTERELRDEEWEEPLDRTIEGADTSAEPEEVDAANRALALVAGSLSVVDVLLGAAESPSTVRAEFRLRSLAEFGEDARADIGRFAAVISGGSAVAAVDPPATLPGELDRLESAAGSETIALACFGGAAELPSLITALEHVIRSSHEGAVAIDTILALQGFRNRLRREAAKIIQWLLKRITSLLPPGVQKAVQHVVSSNFSHLLNHGNLVGEVEVAVFGGRRLKAQWHGLDPAERPHIDDTLIEPSLEHIGWITGGRRAIGTFGARIVFLAAHTNPPVAVAYYAVVAAAIAFVVAQAGFGVKALAVPMAAALGPSPTPQTP
jgi:hypothetical protein